MLDADPNLPDGGKAGGFGSFFNFQVSDISFIHSTSLCFSGPLSRGEAYQG